MAQGRDVVGTNFLEMWRFISPDLALTGYVSASATSSSSLANDDQDSQMLLNTLNSSDGFAIVGADKLSVRYPNRNLHGYDVGVVQSNKPAPIDRMLFFFEVCVKSGGEKNQMSIGFTGPGFRMRRQPGWEPNSYGYHGDDGLLYRGSGAGEQFGGESFTTGDFVGGGINFATQEVFFTKNEKMMGKVYKNVKGPLYPTVAVHSQNEELTVNFGQHDFHFKIKEYEAELRRNEQSKIDEVVLPQDASHRIVRSYLQFYGYSETLKLFDIAIRTSVPPIDIPLDDRHLGYNNIERRKNMREIIRSGEIELAIAKLKEWYPGIFADDNSAICFLLHCQKFIELIRQDKPEEAMWYAKSQLGNFYNQPLFDALVKDCVALLAYIEPEMCSVGYLLGEGQKELVADAVNAMILSRNMISDDVVIESCLHTRLEKLLKQLSACVSLKSSLNDGEGEAFSLYRFLNSGNGMGN